MGGKLHATKWCDWVEGEGSFFFRRPLGRQKFFLFKNVWSVEEGILQEIALDRSKGEREINWQSLVAKKLPKNTKVFTAFSTWAIN